MPREKNDAKARKTDMVIYYINSKLIKNLACYNKLLVLVT